MPWTHQYWGDEAVRSMSGTETWPPLEVTMMGDDGRRFLLCDGTVVDEDGNVIRDPPAGLPAPRGDALEWYTRPDDPIPCRSA